MSCVCVCCGAGLSCVHCCVHMEAAGFLPAPRASLAASQPHDLSISASHSSGVAVYMWPHSDFLLSVGDWTQVPMFVQKAPLLREPSLWPYNSLYTNWKVEWSQLTQTLSGLMVFLWRWMPPMLSHVWESHFSHDALLMVFLFVTGIVGLTCAGLVIFNWKLQQGRANEHTSKNLCCRTLNESPCAHEERNGRAVGCCNCHLTQENETEVMSDVGLRKEIPLRQEKRHQAMLASTSMALDTSFKKLKGRDHGPDRACSRPGEALLPARCLGSSGNKKALHDASSVTRCLKTDEKLSNSKHGEVQAQILLQHGARKIGELVC